MITLSAISIGLLIGLIVLLALQIVMGMRVQRLTAPIYEYARSESQKESDRIVNEAKESARKLIADAQTSASALVAAQRADIESRAKEYQSALQALSMSAEQALKNGAEGAQKAHADLMQRLAQGIETESAELKHRLDRLATDLDALLAQSKSKSTEIQKALDDAGRSITAGFNETIGDIAGDAKKHIESRIETLLKDTEEEVDAYRTARKKLVDEHMADLVSEASKIVLRKALHPDEHADLVEQALKEAHDAGLL